MITNHTNQLFISIVAVIVISGTIIITSVIIIIIYIYLYVCNLGLCETDLPSFDGHCKRQMRCLNYGIWGRILFSDKGK